MPENVDFLSEDRIIRVHLYGAGELADWSTSLQAVIEIADREGARLVLVDAREQTSSPGGGDIYRFATSIPEYLRVAIVSPSVSQNKKPSEMEMTFNVQVALETVSKIGGDKEKSIRLFDEYEEALTWLKKNS